MISLNKGKIFRVNNFKRWVSGQPSDAVACKNFWKLPKTVGELHSLLGFLWYYGGYVKNVSIILNPLYDLFKVENNSLKIKAPNRKRKQQKHLQLDSCVQIKFTNDHQIILNKIIDILKSPQVMSFPDFTFCVTL